MTAILYALMLAAAAPAAPRPPEPTIHRFALIASSNDGGPGRTRLRFADSDARAVADVLRQLGGLQPNDLMLVNGVTRSSLRAAFGQLRAQVANAPRGPRREVLVYYSGHSDEDGLRLGREEVSYRELRDWIDASGADVRIAILDSCASGSLIRLRGVLRRPPFLTDLSVDARGYAFLTASSADEAAQESDRIGAAFFTHYLVSGLRGAADLTRDGKVTLAEAYQFAYHETLRGTHGTAAGPQHAAYDFQLAGKGDLVLTDLRSGSSSLVLEAGLEGRLFVREPGGRLLVEMRKDPSYTVQLGLAPGRYDVVMEDEASTLRASVELREGTVTRLGRAQFAAGPAVPTTARGEVPAPAASSPSLVQTLIGQDTLVGQTRRLGGYAGLGFRYTRLGNADGFLAVPEAALLINRRLAIGFLAGGGVSGNEDADGNNLGMGFAGLFLRQFFLCESSPFCFSLGAWAGVGGLGRDGRDDPDGEGSPDAVFLFEPQVGGHLNVTRFLRLGVDVGYRLAAGGDEFRNSEIRGVSSGFNIQVGWF